MKKSSKSSVSVESALDLMGGKIPEASPTSSPTKEKKESVSPFDFINSISYTKDASIFEEHPTAYLPFMVNRGLSYFPDTVLYANEMNRLPHIDKYLQFIYLLETVRPRKRFSKWAKKAEAEDLDLIKRVYKMNETKAREALALLSSEQIAELKRQQETGGVTKNERGRKSRGGDASGG